MALSRESPRVGVTHHRSLWSPDVPRDTLSRTTRPPSQLIRSAMVALAANCAVARARTDRIEPVHILLPPSEGKTAPTTGPSLDLTTFSHSELSAPRQAVGEELTAVSTAGNALEILKAGERTRPEVVAQRHLWDLPCAPAYAVYTGVLYEAATLGPKDSVTIFSGLFGTTSGTDLIPAYRLSMNVSLPAIGPLKTFWRAHLAANPPFADPAGPTVDMRSGTYQVWNPPGEWWDIRVRDSSGKVITHMAKHYRGLLTRALLDARSDEVGDVARTLGEVTVESDGKRRHLTLVPSV